MKPQGIHTTALDYPGAPSPGELKARGYVLNGEVWYKLKSTVADKSFTHRIAVNWLKNVMGESCDR